MSRPKSARRRGWFLATPCLAFLLLFCACGDDDDPAAPEPIVEEPDFRWTTVVTGSDEYLLDRFFRLDLPGTDVPGRGAGWYIEPETIRVYREIADPQRAVAFVAVYEDTTGTFWNTEGSPAADFQAPFAHFAWCREVPFRAVYDSRGVLSSIEVEEAIPESAHLAVAYRITNGPERIAVGDIPGVDEDDRVRIVGELHYRMKLLKAPPAVQSSPSCALMLRNVYQICRQRAILDDAELRIERLDGSEQPDVDEAGIPYVTIFGLDRYGFREAGPDGDADFQDDGLFDWQRGLLFFPENLPRPFAASADAYATCAANDDFVWEDSYLAQHLAPELYDPGTLRSRFPVYREFRFVLNYWAYVPVPPDELDEVGLSRLPWMRAAVPLRADASSPVYTPESRVESIRWFPPYETVQADYLEPGRSGTVEALELYLWAEDGTWDEGDWGGITRGVSRSGLDASVADSVRIWVNDFEPDPGLRSGTLHIDYGRISEDGFWPVRDDVLVVGELEHEDGILNFTSWDGVFTQEEDIGLDGDETGREIYDASYDYDGSTTLYTGEIVHPVYPGPSHPYPLLNGTARNNREDDEDLNGDTAFGLANVYRGVAIELDSPADFDLLLDGPAEDGAEAVAENRAWRMYTIPLSAAVDLSDVPIRPGDPRWITHLRLWFEDPGRTGAKARLQVAGLEFFGGGKSHAVPGLELYER